MIFVPIPTENMQTGMTGTENVRGYGQAAGRVPKEQQRPIMPLSILIVIVKDPCER